MTETTEAYLETTVNNAVVTVHAYISTTFKTGHEGRRNHLGNERSPNHRADGCFNCLRSRSENHW